MNTLRDNIERLPLRMLSLRINGGGWPIYWFSKDVDVEDAVNPDPDPDKMMIAVQRKLCYICGEKLGTYACFLGGVFVGLTRSSNEPPCHRECARWVAMNDQFLTQGITLLWVTVTYDVLLDNEKKIVFSLGEPASAEFYIDKKPASKDEVSSAVTAGLANVLEMIKKGSYGDYAPEDVLEKMLTRYIEVFPS